MISPPREIGFTAIAIHANPQRDGFATNNEFQIYHRKFK
jgi:hypothetical protein